MQSAIYTGWVRHRRFSPKPHELKYKLFMLLLDLSELDKVFAGTRLWGFHRFALAKFKRSDFLGDPAIPLDLAVRQRVQEKTGVYPEGAIRLLANIRYFGFIMNPISCYYCFDKRDRLQFIIAEVNNTPWDERHSYVLPCEPDSEYQRIIFNKAFHVSPFNPMDVVYDWRSSFPAEKLHINMQNWRSPNGEKTKEFDATLVMERKPINASSLRNLLFSYPFMTMKVALGIYWEALKIFVKGIPVFDHPVNSADLKNNQ